MQQLKAALESSTAHGLRRIVSDKPIYVRSLWLCLCLIMLALFMVGFRNLVEKLTSNRVTTAIDVESEVFVFPDVYVCFENPFSGSYAVNLNAASAKAINASLNATADQIQRYIIRRNITKREVDRHISKITSLYPYSLPYQLMIDALAHRLEQSIMESYVVHVSDFGMPNVVSIDAIEFYHPLFLRCFQWKMNETLQTKLLGFNSWAGFSIKILLDNYHSGIQSNGLNVEQKVLVEGSPIRLSDWALSRKDAFGADRAAGVRVFLASQNEYPSDFVTSFYLAPGKCHTVEIDMTRHVYGSGIPCVKDPPNVQFSNPYDQTPYTHAHSFSYCYYYEYHKRYQSRYNLSGDFSPLPWPQRNAKYFYNVSKVPNYLSYNYSVKDIEQLKSASKNLETYCMSKSPCQRTKYSVVISGTDWPTESSLPAFLNTTIKQVWRSAHRKHLTVPALDFLLTANASSLASYARSNLLKVHFKPHRTRSDKLTFARDYGFSSFLAEVGGIMGIYLGMSLLTLCELFEFIYDLAIFFCSKFPKSRSSTASVKQAEKTEIFL